MARLTITLTPEEKAALTSYAREQRRDPRDQAAIELQQVLKRAGFLLPIDGRAAAGLAIEARCAGELATC
ncbi:MAG: hypothetical protein WAZ19_12685 [Anaerolineae bacterium]